MSETYGWYDSLGDVSSSAYDGVTTEPRDGESSIATAGFDTSSVYLAPQLVSEVTQAPPTSVLLAPQSNINEPAIEVDSSKLIVPESNQSTVRPKRSRFTFGHFGAHKAAAKKRSNKLPPHVDPWKLINVSPFWKKQAMSSLETGEKRLNDDAACTLALGINIQIGPIYSGYSTVTSANGLQQRGTLQAVVKGSIREGIVELSATTQQGLERIKVAVADMDGQYFLHDVPLPGATGNKVSNASSNAIQVVDLAQENQSEKQNTNSAEQDQANQWPENWYNKESAEVAPAAFYPSQAIGWPQEWTESM